MRALLAEAKRNLAYADYQNAFGILFVTMGFDVADGAVDAHLPLEILAGALEADWRSQCKRASSMERRTNSSATSVREIDLIQFLRTAWAVSFASCGKTLGLA